MGMKKTIAKRVVWPVVSMGTAWAMDKGYRKVLGRKPPVRGEKRAGWGSTLAWTASTAATAAVVSMVAERGMERAMRRMSERRD